MELPVTSKETGVRGETVPLASELGPFSPDAFPVLILGFMAETDPKMVRSLPVPSLDISLSNAPVLSLPPASTGSRPYDVTGRASRDEKLLDLWLRATSHISAADAFSHHTNVLAGAGAGPLACAR
jgi:hypothetical protein